MLDKLKHITANGKEYPIAFTLNVVERIQEEYGSIDTWGNLIQPTVNVLNSKTGEVVEEPAEPKLKDLIWTFTEFINEGIDIENEEKNENNPMLTKKQTGRILTNLGLGNAGELIQQVTVASTSTGEPKNV